jgi:hypothetical protein
MRLSNGKPNITEMRLFKGSRKGEREEALDVIRRVKTRIDEMQTAASNNPRLVDLFAQFSEDELAVPDPRREPPAGHQL